MTASYIGTSEKLTPSQLYHCRKYVRKHRNGRIKSFHRFDIDMEALRSPFNLDCSNCHLAHHSSCCQQGRPYAPQRHTLAELDKHAGQIIHQHLSDKHVAQFIDQGYTERNEETDHYENFSLCGTDCFFLSSGNEQFCSIHRYALDQKLTLFSLKPASCLMYPLELIEIDGRILITALHRDTLPFCRWDEQYFTQFLCANRELRAGSQNVMKDIPSHAFANEDYLPAYQWGKETIIHFCGDEIFDYIRERV